MKRSRLSKFFVLLAVLTILVGTMPFGHVQAQTPDPYGVPFAKMDGPLGVTTEVNPWAVAIAGTVLVNGQALPGHVVQFYCKGILAGEGTTITVGSSVGILQYTNVYGSDTLVEPPVVQCDEGDRVSVTVDGVKALFTVQKKNSVDGNYPPEIRWKSLDWYLVTILVDAEININWGSDSSDLIITKLDVPSTVRAWFNNSTSYSDRSLGTAPVSESFGDLKSLHLTDEMGRTYLYSMRNAEVCTAGLNFGLVHGGFYTNSSFKNTTPYILQIVLHNGSAVALGGKVYPGGSFEMLASDIPNGAIEVRIMDENGPVCGSLEWDFSYLPEPRIVRVTGQGSDPRLITIEGDNLFFPAGIDYDPESLYVFMKKGGEMIVATNGSVMARPLSNWDERKIIIPLDGSVTQGLYEIGVTVVGDSSNTVLFAIPGGKQLKFFLPVIVS